MMAGVGMEPSGAPTHTAGGGQFLHSEHGSATAPATRCLLAGATMRGAAPVCNTGHHPSRAPPFHAMRTYARRHFPPEPLNQGTPSPTPQPPSPFAGFVANPGEAARSILSAVSNELRAPAGQLRTTSNERDNGYTRAEARAARGEEEGRRLMESDGDEFEGGGGGGFGEGGGEPGAGERRRRGSEL